MLAINEDGPVLRVELNRPESLNCLDDDVLLAGVLAAELAVPAAVAVLRCAEAGRATAIAAAAAALATPAPAVTAASLVLPLRRRCLALVSSASAGSRSGVMKPSSQ